MGDEIAGLDASLHRGCVIHRCDDADETLFLGHFDTQATKFASGLYLHRVVVARGQIAGMRIERGQHPVDRRFDQRGLIHLFHVIAADSLEDIAEQVKLLIDRRVIGVFLGNQRAGDLRRQQDTRCRSTKGRHDKSFHRNLFLISYSVMNHSVGSTGTFASLSSI